MPRPVTKGTLRGSNIIGKSSTTEYKARKRRCPSAVAALNNGSVRQNATNVTQSAGSDNDGRTSKTLAIAIDLGNDSCRVQGVLLEGSLVMQGPFTVTKFDSSMSTDVVPSLVGYRDSPDPGHSKRVPVEWGYGAASEFQSDEGISIMSFPKMAGQANFTDWITTVAREMGYESSLTMTFSTDEKWDGLKFYMKSVVDVSIKYLEDTFRITGDDHVIKLFTAVPAAWSSRDSQIFADIVSAATGYSVAVIDEARCAAVACIAEHKVQFDIGDCVIVSDFGSGTSDFTLARILSKTPFRLEILHTDGNYNGASFTELEVCRRIAKGIQNDDPVREAVKWMRQNLGHLLHGMEKDATRNPEDLAKSVKPGLNKNELCSIVKDTVDRLLHHWNKFVEDVRPRLREQKKTVKCAIFTGAVTANRIFRDKLINALRAVPSGVIYDHRLCPKIARHMVLEGLSLHVTQSDPFPADGKCQIDIGFVRQAPLIEGFHDEVDVFGPDPFALEGEGEYANEVNWLIRRGESTERSHPMPIQVRYPLDRDHFMRDPPEIVISVYTSVQGKYLRLHQYDDDEKQRGRSPWASPMADCEFLSEHTFTVDYESLPGYKTGEQKVLRGVDGNAYGLFTVFFVVKAHHHGGVVVQIYGDMVIHSTRQSTEDKGVRIHRALPPQVKIPE